MQFTDEDLSSFMQIWSEEFHEPISVEDARLSAAMLLDLYSLLAVFQDAGM